MWVSMSRMEERARSSAALRSSTPTTRPSVPTCSKYSLWSLRHMLYSCDGRVMRAHQDACGARTAWLLVPECIASSRAHDHACRHKINHTHANATARHVANDA